MLQHGLSTEKRTRPDRCPGYGLGNAESYVSVSDCAAYAAARDLAFPATPAEKTETALRRATSYMDNT
ncbi:DnaT-like ssDNA-binding protein [Mesorhizobium sp. NPDC059054]|uniref:DnaT-like ssDNA-binding protein n=1 Tax=Mesorhizobium sp. NPDC059054 TaxID=3346711 RepID=UPI0036834996